VEAASFLYIGYVLKTKERMMKKILMASILLSIMVLAACGDDSNTSSVEDECTKDPALCEDNTPDTPAEE
jgi:uncharacterized lipoprotein YajG